MAILMSDPALFVIILLFVVMAVIMQIFLSKKSGALGFIPPAVYFGFTLLLSYSVFFSDDRGLFTVLPRSDFDFGRGVYIAFIFIANTFTFILLILHGFIRLTKRRINHRKKKESETE